MHLCFLVGNLAVKPRCGGEVPARVCSAAAFRRVGFA